MLFTAKPTVAPGEELVESLDLLLAHDKEDAARSEPDRTQKSLRRRAAIRGWHCRGSCGKPYGWAVHCVRCSGQ